MGMVPIPVFSPLTLPGVEEPVLEPALPVSRVESQSADTGESADERYSPSQQSPDQDEPPPQPASPATDPTHNINIFA